MSLSEIERKHRGQVILAFALVYVLWGSTYLAIGVAVKHIPPAMMGAMRFIVAGALMLGWCFVSGRSLRVSRKQLFRLTIIGVLLLCTGNVVLGWAERYIPTGLAALLIAITPLWFLLLETVSKRGDHLSRRGLAGIALGIIGVIALLWPELRGGMRVGGRELFGAGLVMFSSFSWACGSVLSKRWQLNVDPYTASGWEMLMAGLINLAVSLSIGDLHRVVWARESLLAVLYLVIAGSWIGFTAYVWLLRHVPTPKVATYAYVNPIVAVFLGWLFLHEKVTVSILIGSVIIIVSVVLVTRAKLRPRTPSEAEKELELPACESSG